MNAVVPARAAQPLISVVVPLRNEAAGLRESLDIVATTLRALDTPFELIAVDDGSTDATWSIIADAARANASIRGLRLSRQFGKEAALCAGLASAQGDLAVTIDGDLQHPPEVIARMLDAWRSGADVVDGVKVAEPGRSTLGRMQSRLFYGTLRALSGYDLKGASDFKLLDRRALEAYLALPERHVFYRGMVSWLGFQRAEVAFEAPARRAGESQWGFTKLIRLALTAVTSFSSAPLHFITALGFAFLLFALAVGAQTLWRKLNGSAIEGFTTVIVLLLIIGSAIMIGLGVIGEYVARIYDEVKARPRYVVAESVGGSDRD
jgi:glycosyltransferase involved in cell wall biosynthesis